MTLMAEVLSRSEPLMRTSGSGFYFYSTKFLRTRKGSYWSESNDKVEERSMKIVLLTLYTGYGNGSPFRAIITF